MPDINETGGQCPPNTNTDKCLTPPSPNPDPWKTLTIVEDYYERIKNQMAQIDADKAKAKRDAQEKKDDALAQAEDAYQTADAELKSAEKKQIRDIELLEKKIINKKIEIRENFRKALRENLPKNCGSAGGGSEVETDTRVPRDKFAICFANFNKALADEEVEYLKKLKSINDQKADADNKWKKAKDTYDASQCSADAIYKQAICLAAITWRTKISEMLSIVCNS